MGGWQRGRGGPAGLVGVGGVRRVTEAGVPCGRRRKAAEDGLQRGAGVLSNGRSGSTSRPAPSASRGSTTSAPSRTSRCSARGARSAPGARRRAGSSRPRCGLLRSRAGQGLPRWRAGRASRAAAACWCEPEACVVVAHDAMAGDRDPGRQRHRRGDRRGDGERRGRLHRGGGSRFLRVRAGTAARTGRPVPTAR